MKVAEKKGRMLRALFEVLATEPEGLQAKDAIQATRTKIELLPEEEGVFDQSGYEKFPQLLRFATIPAVKAAWLVKDDGTWSITDEGAEALSKYLEPAEFFNAAKAKYKQWEESAASEPDDDEVEESDVVEAVSLEESEDSARTEVLEFLGKMLPFDFQAACAALVMALGHEVRWVSDPGPDGGIDFIAYTDPIGATGRRIKGQAKRQQSKQDVDDVGAFMSKLKADDVGLFIALGGFTKPAEMNARLDERRMILLDGPDFLRLWVQHYESLDDKARSLLTLRPIWRLVRPTD